MSAGESFGAAPLPEPVRNAVAAAFAAWPKRLDAPRLLAALDGLARRVAACYDADVVASAEPPIETVARLMTAPETRRLVLQAALDAPLDAWNDVALPDGSTGFADLLRAYRTIAEREQSRVITLHEP